jgi:hypothetical protein
MSTFSNYSKELNEDDDKRRFYLDAQNEEQEDNSQDESDDQCRTSQLAIPLKEIVNGKMKKKHSTKPSSQIGVDHTLLDQLLKQQQAFMTSQQKVFKLQNEIDLLETKNRYLVLDLNNKSVEVTELKEKLQEKLQEVEIHKAQVAETTKKLVESQKQESDLQQQVEKLKKINYNLRGEAVLYALGNVVALGVFGWKWIFVSWFF